MSVTGFMWKTLFTEIFEPYLIGVKNGAIMEAVLNIVIPVALVFGFGIIGVAIGTLISMMARTVQYIWYYHTQLVKDACGLKTELKRACVLAIEVAIYATVYLLIPKFNIQNYFEWSVYAVCIGITFALIALLFTTICYRKQWNDLTHIMKRLIRRKRSD